MAKQAKMEASNQKGEPDSYRVKSEKSNESKKTNESNVNNQKSVTKPESTNTQSQTPDFKSQAAAPINKEAKKELQKQQRIFQQLEEQIAAMNAKKAALEASLGDPATYSDKNKFLQTEIDYKKAAEELEKLNVQYEKTFELIVSLEGK